MQWSPAPPMGMALKRGEGGELDNNNNCVRRRRTLSNHVVFSRGIDYVPRVSIAMPVDFRVWTPSWTGTLSLDSIWTCTRSLDSMCHIASIPFD